MTLHEPQRLARGWSYEALAKEVTQVGCTVYPSTAFKIERGEPRRKITIVEFVALSEVFGQPLEELLKDPDDVANEGLQTKVKELRGTLEKIDAPLSRILILFDEIQKEAKGSARDLVRSPKLLTSDQVLQVWAAKSSAPSVPVRTD